MLLQAKSAADPKEQESERERPHQPQTSDPAGGRCCRRGLAGWRPGHAPTFADPSQILAECIGGPSIHGAVRRYNMILIILSTRRIMTTMITKTRGRDALA